MDDFVVVLCTCSSREEALNIANAIVSQRLAACANVLPSVESVYRWNDQIQVDTEYLLLIKTAAERLDALRNAILNLHSYETPEVVAVPIVAGSEKYLAWIRECTGNVLES